MKDDGLNPTQCFLLQRPQSERVAEAISQEPGSSKTTPERITFSDKIKRTFPISHEIMNETRNETIEEEPSILDEINESDTISDIQSTVKELNQGEIPPELKFFSGGEKEGETLIANARKNVGVLNHSNEEFLRYLSGKFGSQVLTRNKMKIHVETGQIFHDNQITGESLFDFLRAQEDITKKLLKINIAISDDFEYYVKEVLANITDDRNDMNSNSTSKFLFYHFNMLRQAQ